MKLILHHFLKDVRAQRWLLLLAFLVIGLQILVNLLETQPDYHLASTAEFVRNTTVLSLLSFVLWTVLLARLIQSEPVTGQASFWLTRPVPRSVYIPSKLLFILVFLVAPYLIPGPLDMFQYGVDPDRIGVSVKNSLIADFYLVIIVLWLATYTRGMTQFWIAFIVSMLVAVTIAATAAYARIQPVNYVERNGEVMLTRWALFVLFFASGLILSLLIQHTQRKEPVGFGVGIVGVVIAILAVFFWPFPLPVRFSQAFIFGIDASSYAEKTTSVKYDDAWQQRFEWMRNPNSRQWIGLSSFSTATSTAPLTPAIENISTKFRTPNGEPEKLTNDVTHNIPVEDQFDVAKALSIDLPDIHLSNPPEQRLGALSLFVIHPVEEHLIGKTGTLSITLFGHMRSLLREAAIPLNGPGIAYRPGEIIHVARLPRIPRPFITEDTENKPVLAVWSLGYLGREQIELPVNYYLLVDSQTRSGTFLQPDSSVSPYGGLVGLSSKSSRHVYLPLTGQEPLDRMVLYVYKLQSGDNFDETLTALNFAMSPK